MEKVPEGGPHLRLPAHLEKVPSCPRAAPTCTCLPTCGQSRAAAGSLYVHTAEPGSVCYRDCDHINTQCLSK